MSGKITSLHQGLDPVGLRRLRDRMFEPVDVASIAVFRILFGAIMLWEVWRFFEHDWIRLYYIDREFYFKYYGFEWVHPWPGDGMYYHFIAVGILALCIMTGFFYRITSWLFFLAFTYWYLLDQTRYLNHLYLVVLFAFLLALMPAHRARSFDAMRRRRIRSDTIPAWCLWLFRIQVGIVYFYAGIAKLNADWLRLEPIRTWISKRSDYPIIGPLLESESAAWFFGYGGLAFDLVVAPALLWSKTRPWAFAACVIFHVLNKCLFNIGIFPATMLAATLIMFSPDWPRKLCFFFAPNPKRQNNPSRQLEIPTLHGNCIVALVVLYLAFQVLVPLRHFLYPGNVHWTEEGHRFSWHMKLRSKSARTKVFATDPERDKTWEVPLKSYLSRTQRKKMGKWPDMCLQFSHYLADKYREDGYENVEIRVQTRVSLNGRSRKFMIDPDVDLAKERRTLWPAKWILPLVEPLPGYETSADDPLD